MNNQSYLDFVDFHFLFGICLNGWAGEVTVPRPQNLPNNKDWIYRNFLVFKLLYGIISSLTNLRSAQELQSVGITNLFILRWWKHKRIIPKCILNCWTTINCLFIVRLFIRILCSFVIYSDERAMDLVSKSDCI